jgi:hypothetical protein
MKEFDITQYRSITEALDIAMFEHSNHATTFPVYDVNALRTALNFLCLNGIQHAYEVTFLPNTFQEYNISSLVDIIWKDEVGTEHSFMFWSTMTEEEANGL